MNNKFSFQTLLLACFCFDRIKIKNFNRKYLGPEKNLLVVIISLFQIEHIILRCAKLRILLSTFV